MAARVLTVALFALTACSADPIVGTWGPHGKTIEMQPDGRIVHELRVDPACAADPALRARCAAQQRWERDGDRYQLTLMTVVPPRTSAALGGFGGLFNEPHGLGCRCAVDLVVTAEVHGDELSIEGGKEIVHRVRR